jgi:hypothetical protein
MTMLEEVIQKLKTVDDAVLERVKIVLNDAEKMAAKHPGLPDVRVQRSSNKIAEMIRLLEEFAEPMAEEDMTDLNEAMKRRPWRSNPVDFGNDE